MIASLVVIQTYVLYTSSDHSCIQGASIEPMEVGDQEEQLMDDIADSEVLMSSDVESAVGTPPVYHQVYDLNTFL